MKIVKGGREQTGTDGKEKERERRLIAQSPEAVRFITANTIELLETEGNLLF